MSAIAIGIDLGTTNFRVGVYRNERFEIIPNELHERKTPCCVALIGNTWVVGDEAKHRGFEDIENIFFSSKRMIGRHYNELSMLMERNHWSFEICNNNNNSGKFKIKVKGREKATILPIEISARILSKARDMAEKHLKQDISKVVLTIPQCFTAEQKECTVLAGKIAGLEVLDVITDPIAAAMSYVSEVDERKNILVLSVGGGSYDVSLISLKEAKNISMLYSKGNASLGGQDLDVALFEYYKNKIKTSSQLDKRKSFVFLQECIKAKESLAQCKEFQFNGEELDRDVKFIMRDKHFENIDQLKELISEINGSVAEVLAQSNDVDEIVLAGGGTRIKCIQEYLRKTNVKINHILDVDEAVVQGAAYHAHAICAGRPLHVVAQSNGIAEEHNEYRPSKKDVAIIKSKLAKERDREKKMYDLESRIYCNRKGLTGGNQDKIFSPFLEWIATNRYSASIGEIDIKIEELASVELQKERTTLIDQGIRLEDVRNDEIIKTLSFEAQTAKEKLLEAECKIEELQRQLKEANCKIEELELQCQMKRESHLTIKWTGQFPMTCKPCGTQCITLGGKCCLTLNGGEGCLILIATPTDTQLKFFNMSYHLSDCALVGFHGDLMLIGGYDKRLKASSNEITIYNVSNNSWTYNHFPAMPTKRRNPVATEYGKYIVVAGGYNAECDNISMVEVLDTNVKQWNSVASLPFLHAGMKHASNGNWWFLFDEKVYAIHLSDLVQNKRDNIYQNLPDTPKKYSGVAIINRALLAIGGKHSNGNPSKDIYHYEENSKRWVHLCDLPQIVESCTCILLNANTLMVFGICGNCLIASVL